MIGFLHTAEAHTATFTDLLQEIALGAPSMHLVDESLLIDAQAHGASIPSWRRAWLPHSGSWPRHAHRRCL